MPHTFKKKIELAKTAKFLICIGIPSFEKNFFSKIKVFYLQKVFKNYNDNLNHVFSEQKEVLSVNIPKISEKKQKTKKQAKNNTKFCRLKEKAHAEKNNYRTWKEFKRKMQKKKEKTKKKNVFENKNHLLLKLQQNNNIPCDEPK